MGDRLVTTSASRPILPAVLCLPVDLSWLQASRTDLAHYQPPLGREFNRVPDTLRYGRMTACSTPTSAAKPARGFTGLWALWWSMLFFGFFLRLSSLPRKPVPFSAR